MKNKLCNCTLAVLLIFSLMFVMFPTTVSAADTATVTINGQALIDGEPLQLGNGTVVLDEKSGTLTLDNATINQDASARPGTPVLRADNGDLMIILIGENTITSTTQRPIYLTSGQYTIQGTKNDSLIINTDSDGLQVEGGNLTIDGCNIDITSSNYGGMICLGKYNTGEFGIFTIQNGANVSINSFENTMMGENELVIKDSTVKATARSNQQGWPTSVISSYFNISIVNSAVTATANGEEASAISAGGTVSINNSEVSATITSQTNLYTALSGNNVDITNHSYVTVNSAGSIGIWSPYGSITIQDSIAHVTASNEWPAIRGDNGGTTITGSWIEAFGDDVSPELNSSDSAIFLNNEGSVSGSLTLPGNVTVGKDMKLSIPTDSSIIVPNGITFTNHGQIELLGGSIENNGGTIVCDNHVGGTATCTSKAECDICGKEYGDFLAHELVKTEAKAPTCNEDGNKEYWTCNTCKKYFSDAEGMKEISLKDTVILSTGHKLNKIESLDPTVDAPGNITYWHCEICDKYFSDENGEHEISLEDTIIAKLPKLLEGADQVWTKGSKIGLTFVIDSDINAFERVLVDGKELDPSNYEVKSGSTIVTLKPSYLETLSKGTHQLSIITDAGSVDTAFAINENKVAEEDKPATGILNMQGQWTLLLLSALCMVICTYKVKEKE